MQDGADVLVRDSWLEVNEDFKDYTTPDVVQSYVFNGREMSLKKISIITKCTPKLDHAVDPPDFPMVSGRRFEFELESEDSCGNKQRFSQPLMFVSAVDFSEATQKNILGKYSPEVSRADLSNQLIGYVCPAQEDDAQQLDTKLKTKSLLFQAQMFMGVALDPPFLPFIESAEVSIPAMDHLLGASGGGAGVATIVFHDEYLKNEFDNDKNHAQVFARVSEVAGASPLALSFPADKAVGLVTPSMKIDGLSRSLGPVAQVDSLLSGDLTEFIKKLDGDLLGGISLKEVISLVTSGSIESQIPKLLTSQLPDAIETLFEWHPEVAPNIDDKGNRLPQGPPLPLVTTKDKRPPDHPPHEDKSTQLDLSARSRIPLSGGEPTSVVEGKISNFALNFFDIVLVFFDELQFHTEQGKKTELNPKGVHVEFVGALSLVNQLAKLLPANGFSDGASLDVTSDGINTGYTLGIPNAGVGAFSLENIALKTQLALNFRKPAKIRLAFSEADHPFLVTVSLVGGGGSLAVEVDTEGHAAVEGSLQLGANITIALGIVEANAHVFMGFYFGLKPKDTGGLEIDFIAFIRVGGSVDLLGLVSVSIEMYLGLTFKTLVPKQPGILGVVGGTASLVVGVHLLFIDKNFTLTFEREFVIPARTDVPLVGSVSLPILADPPFDEMVSKKDWITYCKAFA